MPLGQIDAIRDFKPVTSAESRVAVAGMSFDEILAMMPQKTTGILEIDKGSSNISPSPRLHTSQPGRGCSSGRNEMRKAYEDIQESPKKVDIYT